MNVQKRDLLAAVLSYLLLQFTILDDTFDANVRVQMHLSFYTEYTSSPPCNASSKSQLEQENGCQPVRTARPLVLLENYLMIVPILDVPKHHRPHDDYDDEDDVESSNEMEQNQHQIHLQIVDLSPWKKMDHHSITSFPFHAKPVGMLESPIPSSSKATSSTKKNPLEGERIAPIKLVASPMYSFPKHRSSHHSSFFGYQFVLSIWNNGFIALYQIPPPSDTENVLKFLWKDAETISNLLDDFSMEDTQTSQMIIKEVDAVFHTNENETKVLFIHLRVYPQKSHNFDNSISDSHDIIFSMETQTGSILWIHTNHRPFSTSKYAQNSNVTVSYSPLSSSTDCFHRFRSSIMDPQNFFFPHSYWNGKDDSFLHLAHLNKRHRRDHTNGAVSNPQDSQTKRNLHSSSRAHNKYNPSQIANAIISHGSQGIQAYSIRNGHPVCHLSLLGIGNVYADINQDGIVDHVHIPALNGDKGASGRLPLSLSKLMENSSVDDTGENDNNESLESLTNSEETLSCRIFGYSGVPAVEELFQSSSLCMDENDYGVNNKRKSSTGNKYRGSFFSSAPPLILPNPQNGNSDVLLAFHNGEVMKYEPPKSHHYHNKKSDEIWKWRVWHKQIPKWNPTPQSQSASSITPISSSFGKAVLVSGEEGMSALSHSSGQVLSSVYFPQKSTTSRPVLLHVGDFARNVHGPRDRGSWRKDSLDRKDIAFVFSMDGVWGYTISTEKTMDAWNFFTTVILIILALTVLRKVYKEKGSNIDKRCMEWAF